MTGSLQRECRHCGCFFDPNPRVKSQRYCRKDACQRARKSAWQKNKLATDTDYKDNQRACQKQWHALHPEYYRKYREEHPLYCRNNRFFQTLRNSKARVIAKMDAFKPAPAKEPGFFYVLPLIATMDELKPAPLKIPGVFYMFPLIAKEDSIAFRNSGC